MNEPADHAAEIREQVAAEIARQRFGQDFGYLVTWQAVPTPQGLVIGWTILVSLRNPLLGQPRLGQIAQLTSGTAPDREQVAAAVGQCVTSLHQQADALKHQVPALPPAMANGRGR